MNFRKLKEDKMKNISIACLTADLLGGRSFSINYHLVSVVKGIFDNDDISEIKIFSTSINDTCQNSFQEILCDFDIHLPNGCVSIYELDAKDPFAAAGVLVGFDVILCEMFVWSDAIREAQKLKGDLKVIYCIHSVLLQELIANAQNKWVGFNLFHFQQKELIDMADYLIFDSNLDKEYASRFFNDVEKRSFIVYPVPDPASYGNMKISVSHREKRKIRLLYAGRWEYRKGIEQLVECFFRLYAEYGMQLIVLSDYDKMANYEHIFLSPDNSVRFHSLLEVGAISMHRWKRNRLDYLTFMKEYADIVVVPSLYDPFNIIAYDTVQMGIPTVLSKFCGVGELLDKHTEHVMTMNPYDVSDLFGCICKMKTMLQEKRDFCTNSISYGIQDVAADYNKIIASIIK